MMRRHYALFTILNLALVIAAKPCLVFDSAFNLHVFGGTEDVRVGAWDTEPVVTTPLATQGRPPFNGPNVQCFLSQYFNAAYILNADASNPTAVHIYSFSDSSWSTQEVDANGIDASSMHAVLDRNTNVFYGLNNSTLYQLQMGEQTRANEERSGWTFVGNPPWTQNGQYPEPVIVLANNHIHFLNLEQESTDAIFVIHYFWFQPEFQGYESINDAVPFPKENGKAVSFFLSDDEVQTQIAYIPEGGSHTHIIDVISNTTYTMPAPRDTSMNSVYAPGQTVLVQLAPNGELSYLPFAMADIEANGRATWTTLDLDKALFPNNTTDISSSISTGTGTAQVPSSTDNNSGAATLSIVGDLLFAILLFNGFMAVTSL